MYIRKFETAMKEAMKEDNSFSDLYLLQFPVSNDKII